MQIISHFHQNTLRNFSYLIRSDNNALLIDPYASDYWIKYLEENQLILRGLFFTHDHLDHYQGEKDFSKEIPRLAMKNSHFPFPYIELNDGDELLKNDFEKKLQVSLLPGHTKNHAVLKVIDADKIVALFSGDLLFNFGVGNIKNGGNLEDLYQSILKIKATIDASAVLYPGHDYYKRNLEFALSQKEFHRIALELLESQLTAKAYHFSRMENEFKLNPFLNANDFEEFKKLRLLRDSW